MVRSRSWILLIVGGMLAAALGPGGGAQAQESKLSTLRNDVRQGEPPRPQAECQPSSSDAEEQHRIATLNGEQTFSLAGLIILAPALPFWIPIKVLDDDYVLPLAFPDFPYDGQDGYMLRPWDLTKDWAGRFDVEYRPTFDGVQNLAGHLLVETRQRFGLQMSADRLEESSGGRADSLWLGDANLTFRFAQSSRAEFRAGLGCNWLHDAVGSDYGFNFTYGLDWYPVKPVVVSAGLDAGTLGKAGLFRFRSTIGAVYQRAELYTGYEYTDIGRLSWHALLAGVRVWF